LTPGDAAPLFELPDQDGQIVRLADLRGRRVVIFFYPKAMTSGCTLQARAFNAALPEIERRNAVVLGISPDPPARLRRFRAQEGLDYPLLSDVDHAVAEAYGAWGEKSMYGRRYQGILRSHFVIDEEGRLVAAALPVKPNESAPAALGALG
jgi:peroxiredoxin Q/BCP